MSGYLLFSFQLLLTVLIIWQRKRQTRQSVGFLTASRIFMIVFVLTSFLFSLGQFALKEQTWALLFPKGFTSWTYLSPADLFLIGFLLLILLLLSAALCSLTGYAITGTHPPLCRKIWRILISGILFPLLILLLLGVSLYFAYIITMRFVSCQFDDMEWWWTIPLGIFCLMCALGFAGIVIRDLQLDCTFKEYNPNQTGRTFKRINPNP